MSAFNNIFKCVSRIIPKLTLNRHKGQAGRILVVGGCSLYTGAPYYAGISSLKCGGDLSYVICSKEAKIMKSYSPELIIYPILKEKQEIKDNKTFLDNLNQVVSRSHSIVIGPGLGRDKQLFSQVETIIKIGRDSDCPLIFDADGIFMITDSIDLIKGYSKCILTPNIVEFERMYKSLIGSSEKDKSEEEKMKKLSQKLGNVTIVKKGLNDIICNGNSLIKCSSKSKPSPRRSGGQGDVLSGVLGTFSHWANCCLKTPNTVFDDPPDKRFTKENIFLFASYGASLLTKEAASHGFTKFKRGMTTPDIIDQIGETFEKLFPYEEV